MLVKCQLVLLLAAGILHLIIRFTIPEKPHKGSGFYINFRGFFEAF